MSDGITDAEREGKHYIELWKERERDRILSEFTKKEIVEELCKREGVKEIWIEPYERYAIIPERSDSVHDTGAARILVVID